MAEIQLLVTPEELRQKSGETRGCLRGMRLCAARVRACVSLTRGYWRGGAGDLDREGFSVCLEELLAAVEDLEARSRRLEELAGVYQEAEGAVQEESAPLGAARMSQGRARQ